MKPQRSRDVIVVTADAELPGIFTPGDLGIVVFAHGSGSSRLSPRNRAVAGALAHRGFGTLLFDLLTPVEARDRANVFDIALLGRRLAEATGWLADGVGAGGTVGFFGASTGAAAALVAAARTQRDVTAVVSRGGRPDLAGVLLGDVRAPTLLVVGSLDHQVLELNRTAMEHMRCPVELALVEGATHLFEEPGTLERVAQLAGDWFSTHFG